MPGNDLKSASYIDGGAMVPGAAERSSLFNNQSYNHQGRIQGRLEKSFPLPLMDDFYLSRKR